MPNLYDNIPVLLKQHPNWVAWGIRDAPLKSPFNPASLLSERPLPAKAGVRETWGSYQNAVLCVKQGLAQGIGYEFDGSVYGVDLDHVMDEAGMLTPQAQEITRHRKKDYFLEIYSEGRYFTVTGNVPGSVKTIATRTTELQAIHDKFLLPDAAQAREIVERNWKNSDYILDANHFQGVTFTIPKNRDYER